MSKENIFSDNNLGAFIENDFGDRFLYSVNGGSFNKISSHAVFRNLWGDTLFNENTLYLVVGTDSGLLPTYIDRIGVPDGSRYLFIELEEIIPLVKDVFSEDNINAKKIALTSAAAWYSVAKQLSLPEYAYLDSIEIITSVAASDAHLIAYSDFWSELEKEFKRVIWQYQKQFGSLTFITKQIENLAENRFSASCLINSFKGKTAVLLAGGPSLDTLLPWIMENRNRLTLIAVSRISKRLLQLNIEPDIVVTVDPHFCSYEVSKHMLRFNSAILVNAYHASPVLLGQWQGRALYLDQRYPWTTKEEQVVQGFGPTVSNSAINLGIAMGFSQIIFAGLDLCYSQEGFSHAQGSIERSNGAFVANSTQTVETNDGKIAETDNSFYNSISVIEAQAMMAKSSGVRLINPAPTAAKIKNVDHLSTGEIELPEQEYNAKQLLQHLIPEETSESRLNLYSQTIQDLTKVQANISKLVGYANEALKYNDGMFGRNGLKKSFKYKIKMDRVEKKITNQIPEIANIAKIFGMADFVKTLRPDQSREWSDEEIEQTGKRYYNAYLHGAENLSKVVEAQIKRLKLRQEEENDDPDFEYLAREWNKDQTPGRAKLWVTRHREQYDQLKQEDKSILEQLGQQFEKEIDNEDTRHQLSVQRYADLNPVISKLKNLMHRSDIVAMQRLRLGLSTRPEEEAKWLSLLVQAHIAEHEEDMQQAVELYRQIIELDVSRYPRIIEAALIRLSVLCMNCGELALAAECLKNLSGLSFTYMPYYAEALRLSDQLQQAIEIYTGYLSRAPEDLASMMKLGILYKSIGVREGAAWLFDYVYKKDPNNSAAKRLLDDLELSA